MLGLSVLALADSPRPKTGIYKFIQTHSMRVATKYTGDRGLNPNPVEWAERTYKPGETLKVDEFFWDDDKKIWKAKLVFRGQNQGIPMSKLKFVK